MGNRKLDRTELDVLIVGTGFSGAYLLHILRKLGYRVKAIDAASQLGGVWRHNIYPGARVDIEVPTYELNIHELWDDPKDVFVWKERFPGYEELQAYFQFMDRKLNLSKDCVFDTWVASAIWKEEKEVWELKTRDGQLFSAKYFLPCVGYAAKPHVPPLKGLETFEGHWTHTAQWPKEGLELEGRRVGIIGTGASGVQVTI
jgi:cation diffusion facilitator CzcD-associated flavoprotein CzcO